MILFPSCFNTPLTPPAISRSSNRDSTLTIACNRFLFMADIARAVRVSNGIAVVLLFVTGCAFGRLVEYRPWLTGIVMVALGGSLVALTMALGG